MHFEAEIRASNNALNRPLAGVTITVDGRDQTSTTRVVGASGAQPRVGLVVMLATSLIEICRPRVLGPRTSISPGAQVYWLIFCRGAGL